MQILSYLTIWCGNPSAQVIIVSGIDWIFGLKQMLQKIKGQRFTCCPFIAVLSDDAGAYPTYNELFLLTSGCRFWWRHVGVITHYLFHAHDRVSPTPGRNCRAVTVNIKAFVNHVRRALHVSNGSCQVCAWVCASVKEEAPSNPVNTSALL